MLVKAGADVNEVRGGWSALERAVFWFRSGADNSLETLVRCGARVDGRNAELGHAIRYSRPASVFRALFKAGARVNEATHQKDLMPLELALSMNIAGAMRILASAGADVNRLTSRFGTPLEMALHSRIDVRPLLYAGANVNDPRATESLFALVLSFSYALGYDSHNLMNFKSLLRFGVKVSKKHEFRVDAHVARLALAAGARRIISFSDGEEHTCLQVKCRKVIRGHMMKVSRVNLFYRVARLPLPAVMKRFLLHDVSL